MAKKRADKLKKLHNEAQKAAKRERESQQFDPRNGAPTWKTRKVQNG